jgi:hypothetical protein
MPQPRATSRRSTPPLVWLACMPVAESVALDVAVEKKDVELAPSRIRDKAIALVRLMLTQKFRRKASKFVDLILVDEE